MSIADKILFHRKAKNLSQGHLAQKAGINKHTLYKYEKSNINPTVLNIEKIAKALNVEISEFFTPQETPQNASNSDFKLQVLLGGKMDKNGK